MCIFAAIIASICTGITLPLMNIVFGNLVGAFNDFYKPVAEDGEDIGKRQEVFLNTINRYV
jgi:hypothetical protein